jgi:hypothetical protein
MVEGGGGGGAGAGAGAGSLLIIIPEVPTLSVDWIIPMTENPPKVTSDNTIIPISAFLDSIMSMRFSFISLMIMKKNYVSRQHISVI